ncbi:MAG: 50S ribosomal protein L33 [Polyangiaceae bacterium]
MSNRVQVALVCLECGARNYKTTRPADASQGLLEKNKFCKHCNKHTIHREAK